MAKVVLQSGSALMPSVGMSQSGLMVAALIGGFVVYLAMQGKLGTYWTLMTGGGGSASATAPAATPGATTTAPGATPIPGGPVTGGATNPFGLPSSIFPALGGTANPFGAATGGVSNTTGTGGAAIGVPNISLGQFFGLGGG